MPVKVKIYSSSKITLPDVFLDEKAYDQIGKVAEASILDNIRRQQQADGSALKINAPSTRERKRRAGRPVLSLVDRLHRFVKGNQRSWKVRKTTKRGRVNGIEVVPATSELKKLVRYVQEKGYVGWFGINKDAVAAIKEAVRESIRRQFKKARRRRSRR